MERNREQLAVIGEGREGQGEVGRDRERWEGIGSSGER